MRAQLPNAISILRIGLAIPLIFLSYNLTFRTYIASVIIVVVAGVSDALDGFVARRWKLTSELGYVLDTVGDRAVHLALVLAFMVRYHIHPGLVWLLLFRDVCVYGVRLLCKEWLRCSMELRWISLVHATILRIWLCLFIVRDGVILFTGSDALDNHAFQVTQWSLISVTIVVSYWGLIKSFSWLHADMQTIETQ